MAYNDMYRMSAHAIITNDEGKILRMKATYGGYGWHIPGGGVDVGETIQECLLRECREELGCDVIVRYLSGMYYHENHNSHTFIFRCELPKDAEIRLSSEHSEYGYFDLDELTPVQLHRVRDCLGFDGTVKGFAFV